MVQRSWNDGSRTCLSPNIELDVLTADVVFDLRHVPDFQGIRFANAHTRQCQEHNVVVRMLACGLAWFTVSRITPRHESVSELAEIADRKNPA